MKEYYPNGSIARGLMGEHKSLAMDVSGMAQWLGYEDNGAFLAAYGYRYEAVGGRPSSDFDGMIEALQRKYRDAPKPKTIGALIYENPEYKAKLKTLQNRCQELFGVSSKQFFIQKGLLAERPEAPAAQAGAKGASAPGAMELAAYEALKALYARPENAGRGSYEAARQALAGVTIKRSKDGSIYVYRADDCPRELALPYGIDTIKPGAFAGATALRSVVVPETIREIPARCFMDCGSLESVELPQGLESIGESAFENCASLEKLDIPESVWTVGGRAFAGCSRLSEVSLSNPTARIAGDAFEGTAYVPQPKAGEDGPSDFVCVLDKRGNATITGYTGQADALEIPGRVNGRPVKAIGREAFAGNSRLISVEIADSIATIQGGAFRDCVSLKRVHLPNALTNLITSVFNGCGALQEVNIPDGVAELKRSTFSDSPLVALHIGRSLRMLSSRSFYRGDYDPRTGSLVTSRAVESITIDPQNRDLRVDGAAILSFDGRELIAWLGGESCAYIGEGVERIAPYAFSDLANITDAIFPQSLQWIGERAFAGSGLRSVQFAGGLRTICNDAFAFCRSLSAVLLPEGLEELGDRAFAGCPITSVLLPATLRRLGGDGFAGYGVRSGQALDFRIAEGNPWLQADGEVLYEVVEGERCLVSVYGEKYRERPGSAMGLGLLSLLMQPAEAQEEFAVAPGTVHIADGALRDCNNVRAVYLPADVRTIGARAFAGCGGLTQIDLPDGLESIGEEAFDGTRVTELALPAALRGIGPGALVSGNRWGDEPTQMACVRFAAPNPAFEIVEGGLIIGRDGEGAGTLVACFGDAEEMRIPEGVAAIQAKAFMRCAARVIHIPASVRQIGEQAFINSPNLRQLRIAFSEEVEGLDSAVIYLPKNSDESANTYVEQEISNQFLDCIRVDGSGELFDFLKYDSLFETIATPADRALVAVDRLKSSYRLAPVHREQYLRWLQQNAEVAVESVVRLDDPTGLTTLRELGVFTGINLPALIQMSVDAGRPEITAALLEFENEIDPDGSDLLL